MGEYEHEPVLLEEVLDGLGIRADGRYMDCTFGRGGHSRAILGRLAASGRLYALDKDPAAIAFARQSFSADERFTCIHEDFAALREVAAAHDVCGRVDGLLFDLGVSSPQLDDARRGFSFLRDGTLDMRMNNTRGLSAAAWLAQATQQDIAAVLREYGEERFAGRIAAAIVRARAAAPIATTAQLVELIRTAVPRRERNKHPATRSFQAIRIFINRELEALEAVLEQTLEVLGAGGRLVVISFHSLEDRLVKRFLRRESLGDAWPDAVPVVAADLQPRLKLIGKAIRAGADEKQRNHKARSAILRVAERVARKVAI